MVGQVTRAIQAPGPPSRAILIHASLEAENTAPSRRVRELEEFLGESQRLLRLWALKHQF